MRQYLTDKEKDEALHTNGFAVIDFFTKDDLPALIALNKQCTVNYPVFGLNFSFHEPDSAKLAAIDTQLRSQFETRIISHFTDCRLFGGGFINKGIGINNAVPFHQDWTIVAEEETNAIACWIPLSKIDNGSGAFSVIPKSHLLKTAVRTLDHPTLSFEINDPAISPFKSDIPLAPGQGIVYFPQLFHGTYPNRSIWMRRALALTLLPNETTPYFYHADTSGQAYNIYLLPADFHLNYKKYILEKGFENFTRIGSKPAEWHEPDKSDIIRMLKNLG